MANQEIPDPSLLERIAVELAAGWIDFLHHSPEASLDALLLDCRRFTNVPGRHEGDPPILEILTVTYDGEPSNVEAWAAFTGDISERSVECGARIGGIACSIYPLGCADAPEQRLDIEIVFRDRSLGTVSPADSGFTDRVARWCEALVDVALALSATRIELPIYDDDASATVLWAAPPG